MNRTPPLEANQLLGRGESRYPRHPAAHRHEHSDRDSSPCRSGRRAIKMLKDEEGEMRLRVGDYRVRYTEEDEDAIRIHSVKDRKDAYR